MGGNKQKTAVGASDKANANTQVSDTKSSKKEVKISVANAFIKSAESKGIVRNVGGYSGHKVYELVK
ncbi:MAG: hypothetical protein K0S67_692 [Nitrososphaeraceae archaeon]|nr:hypothetical protein [Nitrososphaeraceae archaeon]